MAGDKHGDKSNNREKSNDNIECHLNLSLDEAFSDNIEFTSCPEFQFATLTCYICNGYYGPCFEEPVCATCHAFLFPDDIGLRQAPIFSEKTDDEDSGNDEPTDLYYNAERRVSQQSRSSNPQNVIPVIPSPPRIANEYKNIPNNLPLPASNVTQGQSQNAIGNNAKIYSWASTSCPTSQSNNSSGSNSSQSISLANLRIAEPLVNTRLQTSPDPNDETDENLPNLDDVVTPDENLPDHVSRSNDPQLPWIYRAYGEVGESSRPQNLAERVEMLTNHKHNEHEPINEPGLVERLPPEVLLAVFSYLDDVSLWSAANVCRRWYGLLLTHVPSQQWQQHVKIHWPLYRPIGNVDNWFKVYDRLASSAPCRMCFSLMCLRAEPSRMEENSWRRNRLRSELKSLRIDPPEGIEATPLDQMCCHWQATITGPIGSPYEGGLFYLYLQVPYSYPMCPPVVKFLTKILHPNVSRHGDVGIDSIHHNWSLALTISKVLISVQSLLTDPYCQVCMEPELGEMYMNDRERFEEVARAWTWKYAMHDVVTPT
ncbi:uncharacterized protein morgue [Venturia canescens]|uniref:uncharacterized protein morgue n=1 Tax=Venturia canescens TaxID=32260 RepID=UPI001C9CACC4|nr:uncharacterized protein LOC122412821 [Venturia canescens]